MSNRIKSIETLNRSLERRYSNPSVRGSLFNERVQKTDRNAAAPVENLSPAPQKHRTVTKSDRRAIETRQSRVVQPLQHPSRSILIPYTPQTSYHQTREQLPGNWSKLPKPPAEPPRQAPSDHEQQQSQCPRWLLALIIVISVIGIIGSVVLVRGRAKRNQKACDEGGCGKCTEKEIWQGGKCVRSIQGEGRCEQGFIFVEGRCLACPEQSYWNGTHCIRRRIIQDQPQQPPSSIPSHPTPSNFPLI